MSRRVIIIGAGPGGLASAMLLAKAGADVTILEKQPHVGGRTSAIEGSGYRFDLGPTFFLYPRVLEEIFRAAGTTLRDEVEMIRLDPRKIEPDLLHNYFFRLAMFHLLDRAAEASNGNGRIRLNELRLVAIQDVAIADIRAAVVVRHGLGAREARLRAKPGR